ncbi:MAG: hypothetical protein LBT44_09285 [Clostridiales bacterium]|jgi:hypothetical protein|nr:hypothetical protein [Clostridiales bacterium]
MRKKILSAGILISLLAAGTFSRVYADEAQTTISGTKTLKQFLSIALQPVGETMYVWGGGWNEADTAAGAGALTIGVSPAWKTFFEQQGPYYNAAKTRYMIHSGLDCTGFAGWALFNLIPNDSGYVMKSGVMTETLAKFGWGDWYARQYVKTHIAGDILGRAGHVWISLGTCEDGSVVVLQSSPPGVALYGTQSGAQKSEAVQLAESYMLQYFPAWYAKYPSAKRDSGYVTHYDLFRWDEDFLPDPDNYRNMTPSEILSDLFAETETEAEAEGS